VRSYLDASVLVALLAPEPLSARADGFVRANPAALTVSDFAAAEFASAIARRVRTKECTLDEAHADLADFDAWVKRSAGFIETATADIAVATALLRRLNLPLKTPDAIHIAITQRIGATLVTFDRQMAAAARASELSSRHRKHCRGPRKCAILRRIAQLTSSQRGPQ
jgi:predicted nucleic acid-binding protein